MIGTELAGAGNAAAVAAAVQPVDIPVHKTDPVRNHIGKIETVPVCVKGFRGILRHQDRQAAAGIQVIRLAAQNDSPGQAAFRLGSCLSVELRVGIQHRAKIHHVPAAVREGAESVHPAAAAAYRGKVTSFDLSGHHGSELLHAAFQRADL